jgi:hypothetical protein
VTHRKSLRSQLYRAARDLGDLDSAAKGPGAYAKRRARKAVYRKGNGTLAKVLKALAGC